MSTFKIDDLDDWIDKNINKHRWIERFIEKYYDKLCIYDLGNDAIILKISGYYKEIDENMYKILKNIPWFTAELTGGRYTKRNISWQTINKVNPENGYYWHKSDKNKNYNMHPEIKNIMDEINSLTGYNFNSVLLNRYRKDKIYDNNKNWIAGGGMDTIIMHHDREQLDKDNELIVSVSFGYHRKFRFKYHDLTKTNIAPDIKKLEFFIGEGDLLIFNGNANRYWMHGIPKELDIVMNRDRINLTFRET